MIMVLGIFGLTACNNVSLADYKATKSQALQDYADAKSEGNSYSTEGLAAISAAVTYGKAEIDKATSNRGVDTAYKTATDAIDEVAEDEMAEIVSIHFIITQSFKERQYHKFYDFSEMTYSTKTVITSDDYYGKEEQYEVIATFTEEQANTFFKRIRELGIFDLEESYNDNNVFDGWDWKLVIVLSDETTFESGGYAKHPDQEEAIDDAFLSLAGYKLFSLN